MSRYPYTFAADYVRELGPKSVPESFRKLDLPKGAFPNISRGDATHLYGEIAGALGIDNETAAKMLSAAWLNAHPDQVRWYMEEIMKYEKAKDKQLEEQS